MKGPTNLYNNTLCDKCGNNVKYALRYARTRKGNCRGPITRRFLVASSARRWWATQLMCAALNFKPLFINYWFRV